MQTVYGYHKGGEKNLQRAEKDLFHSISKSYELYHLLLLLILEVSNYAEKRIEMGLKKNRPTSADLNPVRIFVDNEVVAQLRTNEQLLKYVDATGVSWSNNPAMVRNIYEEVLKSELYKEYLKCETSSYEEDKKFVAKLYEKVIGQYEPLYVFLEEQSIFWNDESEFILSMVVKSIKEFSHEKGEEQPLQKEFKDDDDRDFVKSLLRKVVFNGDEYLKLIEEFSKNWEIDRVAFLDIILMKIALAEVMEFPQIPVKVTLNEYIEIAKHYSTPKSGVFINGILDKIIEHLKDDERFLKSGKGLLL
jgi:N utilization substance protein B